MRSRREGYLLIDHRASPGIGEGKLRANSVFEAATNTCVHCQRIVVLNPDRTRDRARCSRCDRYICDQCAVAGECSPFERKLDLALSAVEHGKSPIPLIG